MRLGVMQRRKQYDHGRVGYTRVWMPGAEVKDNESSSFVSTGVHERGTYSKRKNMCRGRWENRRTSLWFIYTPVFAVSQLVKCKR